MHKDEVPQDKSRLLGGERKALYALDESGEYTIIPSSGWEVEETVTSVALEHYRLLAEEALQRAKNNLVSPLEYYMFAKRFNVDTLAQEAGLWRWRVRRHLKPRVFRRLSPRILRRYADVLGISIDQLQRLPTQSAPDPE